LIWTLAPEGEERIRTFQEPAVAGGEGSTPESTTSKAKEQGPRREKNPCLECAFLWSTTLGEGKPSPAALGANGGKFVTPRLTVEEGKPSPMALEEREGDKREELSKNMVFLRQLAWWWSAW
jgi:hypothetical protein